MSLVTDIQSKLAHYLLAPLTLTAGVITNVVTASIDTLGANGLSIALMFDRVFAGTDALTYTFQDSPDNVTWTDVPEDAVLPYSQNGVVADVVVGQHQNVGVFSTERYVRLKFNGVVDTTDFVLTLPYVLELNLMENDRYLTDGIPNDGQP
jgi:hypothetical protein